MDRGPAGGPPERHLASSVSIILASGEGWWGGMVSDFVLGSYVPSSKPKTKSDTWHYALSGEVRREYMSERLSENSICALKPGEIGEVYGRKTLAIPPILSIQMLFSDSL
jgi:hypothetical protein